MQREKGRYRVKREYFITKDANGKPMLFKWDKIKKKKPAKKGKGKASADADDDDGNEDDNSDDGEADNMADNGDDNGDDPDEAPHVGKPVFDYIEAFDVIKKVHVGLGHLKHGTCKASAIKPILLSRYHLTILASRSQDITTSNVGITAVMVKHFLDTCPVCNARPDRIKPLKGGTANPIMSDGFGHMGNLDLADYRSNPDTTSFPGKKFTWFGVLSDHFTGFVLACFALTSKCAIEIAWYVMMAFGAFGAPLILIMDNGKEFLGEFRREWKRQYPLNKTICTRPRNPKANGAAESVVKWMKRILEKMNLSKLADDPMKTAWAIELPTAQRSRNEAQVKWRKASMHELVFGRPPTTSTFGRLESLGVDFGIINDAEDPIGALAEVVGRLDSVSLADQVCVWMCACACALY